MCGRPLGLISFEKPSALMSPPNYAFRHACAGDAVTLSALSIQVFLDTYATEGVRPDLAREAHEEYSVTAFERRIAEPQRRFILAERGAGLLGFAEVVLTSVQSPIAAFIGAELVRLYLQPAAQRLGLGRALLMRTELAAQTDCLWLTAWDGNVSARAFYRRLGYADVGATGCVFQGQSYANRVFAKRLARVPSA